MFKSFRTLTFCLIYFFSLRHCYGLLGQNVVQQPLAWLSLDRVSEPIVPFKAPEVESIVGSTFELGRSNCELMNAAFKLHFFQAVDGLAMIQ